MIKHSYRFARDNIAQFCADQLDRQEVDLDWYTENCPDERFFRWNGHNAEVGIDPWSFYHDLPYGVEHAKEIGMRIFMQRKDLHRMGLETGEAPTPAW